MKGFELAISTIVILASGIMVLVVVLSFLMSSSGSSLSRTEATKIFGNQCNLYKDAKCDWNFAKSRPDFSKFAAACKLLYGDDMNDYICFFGICCQECTTLECNCEALCKGCAAMPIKTQCCTNYKNLFGCTAPCSAC